MIFDPEEKLNELFKKHMSIPTDLSDEEVLDYIHHNLEYCNWYMSSGGRAPREPNNDGEIHIGEDGTYKGHFFPMHIFSEQDEAMRKVEKDFVDYLSQAQAYALDCISTAIKQMMSMQVTPASIQVPQIWKLIVPSPFLGLSCKIGKTPRIFSEAKYGRFVEFTL